MSSSPDPSISRELSRLVRTLEDLRRELEPGDRRRLRPPTAEELRRFTTDVTIPAVILLLETNVRALKLVQRALRLAESDVTDRGGGRTGGLGPVRREATDLTRDALDGLDHVLDDVGAALEGTPTDDEARDLLEDARGLQTAVEQELSQQAGRATGPQEDAPDESVPVDVEAELEAIRDQLDDVEDGDDGDPGRPKR